MAESKTQKPEKRKKATRNKTELWVAQFTKTPAGASTLFLEQQAPDKPGGLKMLNEIAAQGKQYVLVRLITPILTATVEQKKQVTLTPPAVEAPTEVA